MGGHSGRKIAQLPPRPLAASMDVEFAAALTLLLSILAKRGETVKDKDLAKLVTWAREQGVLKASPLIFVVKEWREIGDCMWDRAIQGKAKETTALGATSQIVINTLKTMRAEAKVAASATQVIAAPAKTGSSNFPKSCSHLFNLFRGPMAVRGLAGSRQCSSIAKLLRGGSRGLRRPRCISTSRGGSSFSAGCGDWH